MAGFPPQTTLGPPTSVPPQDPRAALRAALAKKIAAGLGQRPLAQFTPPVPPMQAQSGGSFPPPTQSLMPPGTPTDNNPSPPPNQATLAAQGPSDDGLGPLDAQIAQSGVRMNQLTQAADDAASGEASEKFVPPEQSHKNALPIVAALLGLLAPGARAGAGAFMGNYAKGVQNAYQNKYQAASDQYNAAQRSKDEQLKALDYQLAHEQTRANNLQTQRYHIVETQRKTQADQNRNRDYLTTLAERQNEFGKTYGLKAAGLNNQITRTDNTFALGKMNYELRVRVQATAAQFHAINAALAAKRLEFTAANYKLSSARYGLDVGRYKAEQAKAQRDAQLPEITRLQTASKAIESGLRDRVDIIQRTTQPGPARDAELHKTILAAIGPMQRIIDDAATRLHIDTSGMRDAMNAEITGYGGMEVAPPPGADEALPGDQITDPLHPPQALAAPAAASAPPAAAPNPLQRLESVFTSRHLGGGSGNTAAATPRDGPPPGVPPGGAWGNSASRGRLYKAPDGSMWSPSGQAVH